MRNVAINGFGRIGRAVFKILYETEGVNIVAVNDLIPASNLAYLLKFDTVYGRYGHTVEAGENELIVDGKGIPVLSVKDPGDLPWKQISRRRRKATGIGTSSVSPTRNSSLRTSSVTPARASSISE